MNSPLPSLLCPHCQKPDDCNCLASNAGSRSLRTALGTFATGVAVVTALDAAGQPRGVTINSFASVSLEPPMVLWSLARTASDFDLFVLAPYFCIHVLTASQEWLSNRFASAGNERFAGLEWRTGLGGVPILPGAAAWFEVRQEARYPGGDHLIFVGAVERFHMSGESEPLLFHGGRYRHLSQLHTLD